MRDEGGEIKHAQICMDLGLGLGLGPPYDYGHDYIDIGMAFFSFFFLVWRL